MPIEISELPEWRMGKTRNLRKQVILTLNGLCGLDVKIK
jgi:hypothetical protein